MPSGVEMTKISDPPPPTVPRTASPVYAFNTRLDAGHRPGHRPARTPGATVYRATDAFDFGGRHFDTGRRPRRRRVDQRSPTSRRKALARDTPVYGLPRFLAPRQAIAKPKIAIWTGSASIVAQPGERHSTARRPRTTAGRASRSQEKDKIPAAQLVGLTTTQITAGELTNPANGYTAFIIPQQYSVAANNAIAPIVQQFVNNGGRFLSYYTGGTTSARNIGLTRSTRRPITGPAITTPGSTYDGEFDTDQPGRVGLRQGRLHLPRRVGQLDLQPGHARRRHRHGRHDRPAGDGADPLQDRRPELRLRGQQRRRRAARRPPGGGRPAVRRRPRVPVRVGPVLPGLARVGRAPGAQRADLPDGRRPAGRRRPQPREPAAAAEAKAEYAAARRAGRGADRRQGSCRRSTSRPVASTVPTDADIRITVSSFDAKALRKAVTPREAAEEAPEAA